MQVQQESRSSPSFAEILLRSLRRVFLALCAIGLAGAVCALYAFFVEPHWVCVRHVRVSDHPTARIIHITDIHYKGDRAYMERVVRKINAIDAAAVCFTGDMVEEAAYLPEVMEIFSKLNKPMYGVEGNHDRWALRSFKICEAGCRATGGDWLIAMPALLPASHLALVPFGAAKMRTPEGCKRVILDHYPTDVEALRGVPFDVMLAGHTHGGQVRIPFFNNAHLGPYVRGLYRTPFGPLYVNHGIGTFYLNVRFLCRPEIAVIEL